MGRASENTGNAYIADCDPLGPKGTVYIQNTRSGPRDGVGQGQSQASDLGPGWVHSAPAHEVPPCLQMSLNTALLGTGKGGDSSMRPGALWTEEEGALPGCCWLQAKAEFWFCRLLAG